MKAGENPQCSGQIYGENGLVSAKREPPEKQMGPRQGFAGAAAPIPPRGPVLSAPVCSCEGRGLAGGLPGSSGRSHPRPPTQAPFAICDPGICACSAGPGAPTGPWFWAGRRPAHSAGGWEFPRHRDRPCWPTRRISGDRRTPRAEIGGAPRCRPGGKKAFFLLCQKAVFNFSPIKRDSGKMVPISLAEAKLGGGPEQSESFKLGLFSGHAFGPALWPNREACSSQARPRASRSLAAGRQD